MLDRDNLIVSECDAIPGKTSCSDTEQILVDLLKRRDAEDKEFQGTKEQYQKHSINSGATLIFDSRGAHPWQKQQ